MTSKENPRERLKIARCGKLSRLQFSLRSMLVVTTLFAVMSGLLFKNIHAANRQANAIKEIKSLSENRLRRRGQAHFAPRAPQNEPVPAGSRIGSKSAGGRIGYDFQRGDGGFEPFAEPPGPAWLRNLLGDDFFTTVVLVEVHSNVPIKQLDALPYVQIAYLLGPHVGDDDIRHLSGLTRIEILTLGVDSQVTDDGLDVIGGLTQLRLLDLSNTMVTDAGLEKLRGLRNLKRLMLPPMRVSPDAIAKLKKALPGCTMD